MDSKCLYCGCYDLDRCSSIVEAQQCSSFKTNEFYKYKPGDVVELPKYPSPGGYPIEDKRPPLTGGSSDYYKIPVGATDLLDLIEHKGMSFGLGNIFKACYRLGEKVGTSRKYDLEKIIFFANRELERIDRS